VEVERKNLEWRLRFQPNKGCSIKDGQSEGSSFLLFSFGFDSRTGDQCQEGSVFRNGLKDWIGGVKHMSPDFLRFPCRTMSHSNFDSTRMLRGHEFLCFVSLKLLQALSNPQSPSIQHGGYKFPLKLSFEPRNLAGNELEYFEML